MMERWDSQYIRNWSKGWTTVEEVTDQAVLLSGVVERRRVGGESKRVAFL